MTLKIIKKISAGVQKRKLLQVSSIKKFQFNRHAIINFYASGTDTTPNEFVYHAAFKTISAIFSEAICGGTISKLLRKLTAHY